MSNPDIKRYLQNLDDELNGVALYQALADGEANAKIAEVYRRLAAAELHHADAWAKRVQASGGTVPAFHLSWRTRTLAWLARRFGPQLVLPSISSLEESDSNHYAGQAEAEGMSADEQSHARLLRQIGQSSKEGMEGSALAQLEGRHRTAGGNALRAAVLGANDGLVSNLSLVMGVAGAELNNQAILLTGFAGLLAGAISMALGEWISVQSSRELYEKQIRTEKEEIATSPEEEIEELSLIYQARGVEERHAREMATNIMRNQDTALETLAREELGIDPEELGGSAWEAAVTSFVLFALGAILPVIAFVFFSGTNAIIASGILSAIGLYAIGAAITLFTGRSVLFSGARQVLFGLAAAVVTYTIGRLIGVNLGG